MKLLAIESSCDETAAAVFEEGHLKSNIIASQDVHISYGGVVPELASRAHIAKISAIVRKALHEAQLDVKQIDAVAATAGPGLAGSLIVGLTFAKGIAMAHRIPFIGINHIEGHIFSACIENKDLQPPFLALVVSGGHSMIVLVKDIGDYNILGTTIDDAAGEAYDKVAKVIGLPYPGGPNIDKIAQKGNPEFHKFPVATIKDKPYCFSFSGLKTAVLYKYRSMSESEQVEHQKDIAASFQKAVIDAIHPKITAAMDEFHIKKLVMVGGVARNSSLRKTMANLATENGFQLYVPSGIYCTDNAAMIGQVALLRLQRNEQSTLDLSPSPNLTIN
ncbi:MAG: tRNA (adenosine(37)-N6)-threonylcarbamoyltransferase complex transferase subunit TsaD [Deferribacteres bacterium]|nr:tRNA (adenosine(37)-N6)-threonylcarbamoyltransferase complex transferase subunit TsaD [candidate division KSB1 bacterium]MCB9502505.1 tRNA (adenosine(37)-N6)-threonylcarbamoyltransferase complex transferase subunit TsaD [Deferribacteres bacterium]